MTSSAFANLNVAVLRMFVRVVETGNVSAAARSLSTAQSAVSTQISTLSKLAGTPLLQRTSGRWEPTAQGRRFYDTARGILAALDALETDLASSAGQYAGHLRIVATRTIADTILGTMLVAFARDFPDVRIEVASGARSSTELALASDDVELALVAMPVALRGLDVLPFDTDELVAVLPPSDPLARRNSVRFEELETRPLVTFEEGSGVRALLEERLGPRFALLDLRLAVTSNDAIVTAVEGGYGFSFLPRRTANRWAGCGAIAAVAVSDLDLRRQLALVRRSGRTHSALAVTFAEWLIARSNAADQYVI